MMNNLSFRKKAEYTALVVTLNHGISPVLGSNYVNLELLVKRCGRGDYDSNLLVNISEVVGPVGCRPTLSWVHN
jgi:hypothetical protein